jgi:Zn-dependent alcohol dehydrogenase
MAPQDEEASRIRPRSTARVIGLVLVGVAAVFGLFIVAAVILVVIAFNSYGSNK